MTGSTTMLTVNNGNSKATKSAVNMNHSHNGLGSRTASRALDTTHDTIKTRLTDTRRTASSNNLSASFNTLENYAGHKSVGNRSHFMRPTKSSRSKFTVR